MTSKSLAAAWLTEINEMTVRERSQRSALVGRGASLLAVSIGLVTLVVSASSLANVLKILDNLSAIVITLVQISLVALATSAIIGALITLPSKEGDVEPIVIPDDELRAYGRDVSVENIVADYRLRRSIVVSLRSGNHFRAWALFYATMGHLIAMACLVVAAWLILA